MNRLQLVLRQLRYRRTSTLLTLTSVTLAVGLVISIIVTVGGMRQGILGSMGSHDIVVGKMGSETQLILSTLFHLEHPIGNISYGLMERLEKDERVAEVIPIGIGDNFRGYRMVGTTPAYLKSSKLELIKGKMFDAPDEAVIGAQVAKSAKLKVGDTFFSSHGIGCGHYHASTDDVGEFEYTVVGILAPTGTPNDKLVFTSLESVWMVHGLVHEDHGDDGAEHHHDDGLSVTALLVKPVGPSVAMALQRELNAEHDIQAVFAVSVVRKVLDYLGTGGYVLLGVAFVSVVVSALALFISMASAAVERRRDVAVLRALGARRKMVFSLVCLEAVVVATIGTGLGYVLGQLVALGLRVGIVWYSGITPRVELFSLQQMVALMAAIILGTLAGLVPAAAAYSLDPTKHLS